MRLAGPIVAGNANRLATAIKQAPAGSHVLVALASIGGPASEGFQLATIIEQAHASTMVGESDVCAGAVRQTSLA